MEEKQKKLIFELPVGYVSLGILREYYLDYIRGMMDGDKYIGDPQVLIKYDALEKMLRGIDEKRFG